MILRNSKRVKKEEDINSGEEADKLEHQKLLAPCLSPTLPAHMVDIPPLTPSPHLPPIVVAQYVSESLVQPEDMMRMDKDKSVVKQMEEFYTNDVIIPSLVILPCFHFQLPSPIIDTSMDDFLISFYTIILS